MPERDVTIALQTRRELVESSAAAPSRQQPGVVFTVNDSGNEPLLFAFDTSGADRGAWRIARARNVDWEAVSAGPCLPSGPPACIYIGDTGDNGEDRARSAIYRVAEPQALSPGATSELPAERLAFRYADGPHNVEAMYVGADGTVYLITKRPRRGSDGRLRPALVFAISASAWNRSQVAVADFVDSLPLVPGSAPMRLITDAALAPDAHHVAVRTYAQVYLFAADLVTGRIDTSIPPAVCNVARYAERPGEGVGWLDARGTLILTAEGRHAPAHVIACALPRR